MTDNNAVRILSAGAPKAGVRRCAERFSDVSRVPFELEFATAPVLESRVGGGEAGADVVVAPVSAMETFTRDGRVVPGSEARIGAVTAGVAVRNGAREPDLSSVEAFTRDLLAADALVYNEASSGRYIARMIERLGIADRVAAKTVRTKTGRGVLERLASSKSDNEIGFGQITEIRLNEDLGVHLVGPLPEPIGKTTDYAAAVLADAARPEDARGLVAFMTSPEGKEIFVATGVV